MFEVKTRVADSTAPSIKRTVPCRTHTPFQSAYTLLHPLPLLTQPVTARK